MNLPKLRMDQDGYPTDEFLEWIRSYDTITGDSFAFIQIILTIETPVIKNN